MNGFKTLSMSVKKTPEEMAGFIFLTSLLEICGWRERTWVPMSPKKQLSKTRVAMEKAASYIARCEIGIGLDKKKLDKASEDIKNWMFWFVQNMTGKVNQSMLNRCNEGRLDTVFRLVVNNYTNPVIAEMLRGQYRSKTRDTHEPVSIDNKLLIAENLLREENLDFKFLFSKIPCEHTDHSFTDKTAQDLAVNVFNNFYREEVRALGGSIFQHLENSRELLQNPTISPYFSREPGYVEFAEIMKGEDQIPRNFAEVPCGEYYLTTEDEHAQSSSNSDAWAEYFSDDEYVENESGQTLYIDYESRNDRYFDLRREILHAKSTGKIREILQKANNLVKIDNLAIWQLSKLQFFAAAVVTYKTKRR